MAIAVVVVWGLTYISTKVLIQQGLHPHEIFFYRFLVAYAGIWLIAPRRLHDIQRPLRMGRKRGYRLRHRQPELAYKESYRNIQRVHTDI